MTRARLETIHARMSRMIRARPLNPRASQPGCAARPPGWANGGEQRTDVIFLRPKADRDGLLDAIAFRPEVEDVLHVAGALVWHVMRANVNRSGLRNLIGTELYGQMTIRNLNTV